MCRSSAISSIDGRLTRESLLNGAANELEEGVLPIRAALLEILLKLWRTFP